MITAAQAIDIAQNANETINKERYQQLKEQIEFGITSKAETGHGGTYFDRFEFGDVTGIEFIIADLQAHGFDVTVHSDYSYKFQSMYVSWAR